MNVLVPWRYGQILCNEFDAYIGKSLIRYGEFSESEVELFRLLLQPGMVVLDIGANIGCHTIPIAEMVGEEGRVYAFEPQRIVFQTLCANVALHNLKNVFALNMALGSEPGQILVPPIDYASPDNFGGISLGITEEGESVDLLRLDDLNIPECAFIKIDVEGMERQVLDGARELIERDRPWLYVENDREEKSDALIRLIHSLGYDLFWHRPYLFNVNNMHGVSENVFPDLVSINMLCIPTELNVQVPGLTKVEVPEAV